MSTTAKFRTIKEEARRALRETDWDDFWNEVYARYEPRRRAYEEARFASLRSRR